MKLVLDVGNTRAKVGVFSGQNLVFVQAFGDSILSNIKALMYDFPITRCILSSVGGDDKEMELIKVLLKSKVALVDMSNELCLPIINHYQSPNTLGGDRLAAVVGAHSLFPFDNCLVINAGSCITIDIIDSNANYYGGSISLGIRMKFKSLNNFTANLPLITDIEKVVNEVGENTDLSIKSGVLNGTLMELRGFISYYRSKYKNLKVILAGGDSGFIHNNINEDTIHQEYLVLYGLNTILDANV